MSKVFSRQLALVLNAFLSVFLVVALVAQPAPASPQLTDTPRAHPTLLEVAVARPASRVAVIVQKLVKDKSPERFLSKLGGVVTGDLHIINAFAAELPAGAVLDLARHPHVRWISPDAPVADSAGPIVEDDRAKSDPVPAPNGAMVRAIGADRLWEEFPTVQGQGITVAVVDSGIAKHDDLRQTTQTKSQMRILAWKTVYTRCAGDNCISDGGVDFFGHGTHVAGVIGGNGAKSSGRHSGVAPKVNLLSVKVSDDRGAGTTRSVVMGLQWILEHKAQYNIRIVNLSLNSKVPESYHVSPLNAALEVLWFNGIVVVVSAGNSGTAGYLYPPANDPFVITVGATDDRGTPDLTDDVLAHFSAYGTTESGFAKPDIVAPGTNLVSLSAGRDANLSVMHSDHRVDGSPLYFRMSGTSMSAAVATGAIALLLQREPNLNPDQVKFRLKATARQMAGPGFGAGHLDIYAAINTPTTERANIGTPISHFITGADDQTVWDSVNWDSVNWDSVNWDSVNWDSVNWDSVNWDSVNWDN